MGKSNGEHLKRMNTTGIDWKDLTEEQKTGLKEQWHEVVTNKDNLYCTCPRTFCENNRKCKRCVALHRYYDGFPDCLRPLHDNIQSHLPVEKRYHEGYKMLEEGAPAGIVDPLDLDSSRERLQALQAEGKMGTPFAKWSEIVTDPANIACKCPQTDCKYHGNCVMCVALHRHYEGAPACLRYLVDNIDAAVEAYETNA